MRKTLYVIAIALMISTVTGIYDPNGTQTNCETDEPCVMTKTADITPTDTTNETVNTTDSNSTLENKEKSQNFLLMIENWFSGLF
jgi:hypothetical protein